MVEKVKNLNWHLYSDIGLMLANIFTLLSMAVLAMNTKELANSHIMVYFLVIGLMAAVLLKLNHAAANDL